MKTVLVRSGLTALALWTAGCGGSPENDALPAPPSTSNAGADAGTDAQREVAPGAWVTPEGGATGDSGMAAVDGRAPVETGTGPSVDGGAGNVVDACDPMADDPPDDDGVDTNCDGVDGVAARDIYVDVANSSDNYRGSPDAPVATLVRALTLAQPRKARILVRAGNYAALRIDGTGTWAIYGGYGSGFRGKPNRDLTVLVAPAEGLLVNLAANASIHHLTILGANATTSEQRSAHGLRVYGAEMLLDDVVVQAGNAGSGQSGGVGSKGLDGNAGSAMGWVTDLACEGQLMPLGRGAGFQLPNPENAPPGDLCTGRLSATGSKGQEGSPGADASTVPRVVDQLVVWDDSQAGPSDATSGIGGSGGGSAVFYPGQCSSNVCDDFNYCSLWGGGGGTGGCPGSPGQPAQSGGGSIAIVVLSGKVIVDRSTLITGFAGNGGNGGSGGEGGAGGPGGAAQKGRYGQVPSDVSAFPAAIGGRGGDGGKGGRAGAGAGGWTIGVLGATGTTAELRSTTQLQLGGPGVGGQSATGNGPVGEKHATYQLR